MLDSKELAADLRLMRESAKLTLRQLAKRAGLSREIVRKIDAGIREPSVIELIAWLEACGTTAPLWLSQYLTEKGHKVRERDKQLTRQFLRALRMPSRRHVIESVLLHFSAEDERLGVHD